MQMISCKRKTLARIVWLERSVASNWLIAKKEKEKKTIFTLFGMLRRQWLFFSLSFSRFASTSPSIDLISRLFGNKNGSIVHLGAVSRRRERERDLLSINAKQMENVSGFYHWHLQWHLSTCKARRGEASSGDHWNEQSAQIWRNKFMPKEMKRRWRYLSLIKSATIHLIKKAWEINSPCSIKSLVTKWRRRQRRRRLVRQTNHFGSVVRLCTQLRELAEFLEEICNLSEWHD